MIRRKILPDQEEFWVARKEIRPGKGSGFYDRLGRDLDKEGFGDFVRALCEPFYSGDAVGRPPIDPEVYFKMLFGKRCTLHHFDRFPDHYRSYLVIYD